MPAELDRLLPRLADRRAHLAAAGTTFCRLAHTSETAGLFALDRAGRVGVLSLYADLSAGQEQLLAAACARLGLESVYLKRRPQEARHAANVERERLSPPQPIRGEVQEEVTVLESGVPYLIRPGPDLSIGLFGDARPAREWVRRHAPVGGRVLNTFAYTCGFGLNAALAGAQTVKNLDLSRKVLAWGQENYTLSGLPAPDHDFLYGDVFDWLGRLQKRGELFELVVLDPPSFARSKVGVWRSERDYARLLAQAAAVTAPGGQVLALCNHAGLSAGQFEKMLEAGAAQAGRRMNITDRFGAGEDYPGAGHLKVRALRLDPGG
ncbi:rRNA (guanine-N2)-methyltransferase [Deinococcus irradiatisoli]|uniref:rRNA (Guanine-N2)-methyltransferase n=1 Tax=Deinococcus irradiatisoli TaxID=2202254 RepID=A0A2Z3JVV0_9DEIO|nr:rRNA (guanine-N2)-methyltransferase [Deinococcus irradiatisoli]